MKYINHQNVLVIGLAIIFLFLSSNFVNFSSATWGVSDDFEVDYVLENAEWTITHSENEQTGTGAQYKEINIPLNEVFEVTVDSVDEVWGVQFIVDNTTDTTNGFLTNDLFMLQFEHFLYYPAIESERLYSQGFDIEEITRGPFLIDWFFVEPTDDLWDFLVEVANIQYHQERENNYDYEAYFESDVEKAENEVVFDINMYGDFINSTLEIDMQFQHNIKFIWEEDSGKLLGYRISTSFSGTFYGLFISESLDLVLKENNYSLPNFKFVNYTGLIPGFTMFISMVSLIVFVSIIVKIRRNKK